jgi:TolB-like protein/class 3 adenylate cyclase/Flp pilus assembly protein TadD
MEAPAVQRRLAAILAADVAGYSRMMVADEEGTLRTLNAYRSAISDLIAEHNGRIFGAAGDSVIAEFASAVQAVRSAVAIQRALHRRNADLEQARRMEFRIGVNIGDIIADGDDLLGDGVNVAARLQEVAAPSGICISGALRDQIENKLTFPIAHLGERMLKNIPRPVQAFRVDWRLDDPSTSGVLGGALALPDKPSIAVLPFANMSGDPEQEYFADGITEDIITALSQNRWFFVIARNSTFTYKGRAVDVKQVARDFGVRYVLEGSVRKAGQRVRITGQLIEAESGNHLWAERFDRDLADIFSIQDEITERVVAAIEPEMLLVEGKRAARKSAANLDAFDSYMRGLWHFHQLTAEDSRQALTWLRRAIELDPRLAQAHAFLARTLNAAVWYGWSQDPEREIAEACEAANRAVTLDDRDPYCHYALCLLSFLTRRYQQALSEAQRAIDLNPNFALGYFGLGWVRIYIGHFAEAIDPLLRCTRLNPNDPQLGMFMGIIALAHYHQQNYEEAAHYAERGLRGRRVYFVLRTYLATLGQLGRTEEASAIRAEMERMQPGYAKLHWSLTNPYADPAHQAHLADGLQKAGVQVPAS